METVRCDLRRSLLETIVIGGSCYRRQLLLLGTVAVGGSCYRRQLLLEAVAISYIYARQKLSVFEKKIDANSCYVGGGESGRSGKAENRHRSQ